MEGERDQTMEILLFFGYEFLSTFVPFLLALGIGWYQRKKSGKRVSGTYYMFILIFALYIYGVYHLTGMGTVHDGLRYGHLWVRGNQLNFIPFSYGVDITSCLNIALFIPFGFLIPVIWEQMSRLICVIGSGFAFSFLIEMSQLLNSRCTDVDDLIFNTLGAVTGFGLFKLWNKRTGSKYRLQAVPSMEMPIFVLSMFAGRFLLFDEMGFAGLIYNF